MWLKWFNHNFMKLWEYFLCAKKTKITTFCNNLSPPWHHFGEYHVIHNSTELTLQRWHPITAPCLNSLCSSEWSICFPQVFEKADFMARCNSVIVKIDRYMTDVVWCSWQLYWSQYHWISSFLRHPRAVIQETCLHAVHRPPRDTSATDRLQVPPFSVLYFHRLF